MLQMIICIFLFSLSIELDDAYLHFSIVKYHNFSYFKAK